MPEADRKLRVFLCHSSSDKPTVRDLYRRLESEGWIDPWLDAEKLYPGQDWNFEIEKAVEEADVILICLTKGSVNKEGYVQRELRIVLDLADYKPEGTLFVIPVRLEECDPPRRLRSWQYADYFPEKDRDRAYRRLLVSLKMRADRLSLSTENPEEVRKAVKEEQVAANKALVQQSGDIKELVKPAEEKLSRTNQVTQSPLVAGLTEFEEESPLQPMIQSLTHGFVAGRKFGVWIRKLNLRSYGIGTGILLIAILGIFGIRSLLQNTGMRETATPTAVPALGIGSTLTGKDGMTLLYVPAGEFKMGSDNGNPDEKPVHTVSLDAFWIDQTEVTNGMYGMCVKAGVCNEPSQKSSYTRNNYYGKFEFDNYPVIYVSWNNASTYCSWADRRLPTEAEWEKAASWNELKNEKYIYPWGNSIDCSLANFIGMADVDVCVGDTSSVGSYQAGASPYGALDMAGNVLEWVADWYEEAYYQNVASSDPLGPDSGQYRVTRGGAFGLPYLNIRSTYRFWSEPTDSDDSIGFRCAMFASE